MASVVSAEPLPMVVMRTLPSFGAVHVHQTDRCEVVLKGLGSPVSAVAPTLYPVAVSDDPTRTMRFAKLSLAGAAAARLMRVESVASTTKSFQRFMRIQFLKYHRSSRKANPNNLGVTP